MLLVLVKTSLVLSTSAMFPVNNWAAPDPTVVIVKLEEAPLLVIVPVAVERLLMVLL